MSSATGGIVYGPKPESHNYHCAFMSGPQAPTCLAPATWHGLILSEDCSSLQNVTASCDQHKAAMTLSADFIHPHDSACQLPGSRVTWDGSTGDSHCYVDWDISALSADVSEPVTA